MVVSTFLGGIFMAGVQTVALQHGVMQKTEYNDFIVLLGLLMLFGAVPSAALQTIFAQQSAAALTDESKGELTRLRPCASPNHFSFWLVVAGLAFIFARPIASALAVKNPAALRVAMLAVLAVIWGPTLKACFRGCTALPPWAG